MGNTGIGESQAQKPDALVIGIRRHGDVFQRGQRIHTFDIGVAVYELAVAFDCRPQREQLLCHRQPPT